MSSKREKLVLGESQQRQQRDRRERRGCDYCVDIRQTDFFKLEIFRIPSDINTTVVVGVEGCLAKSIQAVEKFLNNPRNTRSLADGTRHALRRHPDLLAAVSRIKAALNGCNFTFQQDNSLNANDRNIVYTSQPERILSIYPKVYVLIDTFSRLNESQQPAFISSLLSYSMISLAGAVFMLIMTPSPRLDDKKKLETLLSSIIAETKQNQINSLAGFILNERTAVRNQAIANLQKIHIENHDLSFLPYLSCILDQDQSFLRKILGTIQSTLYSNKIKHFNLVKDINKLYYCTDFFVKASIVIVVDRETRKMVTSYPFYSLPEIQIFPSGNAVPVTVVQEQ